MQIAEVHFVCVNVSKPISSHEEWINTHMRDEYGNEWCWIEVKEQTLQIVYMANIDQTAANNFVDSFIQITICANFSETNIHLSLSLSISNSILSSASTSNVIKNAQTLHELAFVGWNTISKLFFSYLTSKNLPSLMCFFNFSIKCGSLEQQINKSTGSEYRTNFVAVDNFVASIQERFARGI